MQRKSVQMVLGSTYRYKLICFDMSHEKPDHHPTAKCGCDPARMCNCCCAGPVSICPPGSAIHGIHRSTHCSAPFRFETPPDFIFVPICTAK